jgi:hypothetical protein
MSDVQKHFFEIFEQITSDLGCNKISKREFNKKVLTLSYDAALRGFEQDSLLFFLEIDESYFNKDFIQDADTDESLHRKCIFLYELYKYLDYIDWNVEATQKEALA